MGYDYSKEAIKELTHKNIPCQLVDLNNISETQSYLNLDIDKSPINFIAIRVVQYLEDKALAALIITFLNNAVSDSRFIISNNVSRQFPKNYIASFFGARTDVKIMLIDETPKKIDGCSDSEHHDNEVLVVQKL
ncbi:hypothetical protein ACQUW5_00735 [Legionella sp. CNM-1927-20]|uniref:hypothetical protein n=1 Tax=Legionella sp. CNM-1927-20 TaxID=3422221 RepID=UPI00403ABE7F